MYGHLGAIWVTTKDNPEPFLFRCSKLYDEKRIKREDSVLDYIINETDLIISNELNDIFLFKNSSRNSIQVIVRPSGEENFARGWIDKEFRGAWHRKNTLSEWFNKGGLIISKDVRLNS